MENLNGRERKILDTFIDTYNREVIQSALDQKYYQEWRNNLRGLEDDFEPETEFDMFGIPEGVTEDSAWRFGGNKSYLREIGSSVDEELPLRPQIEARKLLKENKISLDLKNGSRGKRFIY